MTEYRILIVDDEAPMLRTVERILGGDHEVLAVPSPETAIVLAPDFKPHVAVIDVRMAGMDGFQLMNMLKQLDQDVQVILMTGSAYDIDDQLIRAIREKAFYYITKPFDREVLRTLVQRCLELRTLEDANRRHVRHLEGQLAEARAFQMTMLPAREASLEGFDINAAYLPCEELGGDLYDYASASPDTVSVVIADVAGHGASAAMLTGIVKSAFHASLEEGYHPSAVVKRVEEGIRPFRSDRFITMLCASISISDGTMTYINAGHFGGTLANAGEAPQSLDSTGPLISPALPIMTWEVETVAWRSNTRLLLYTDGIPETECEGELFQSERIHKIIEDIPSGGPELLSAILSGADSFARGCPPVDDRTLITVHYGGKSELQTS
ncbi:MAG: SpoIIE family protein phosphatase [Candidatus Latescibacteria bacterium]|nr:SpoIIE family protein phosphatase [Candidatus Latescibacterota bacterium]